MRVLKIVTNDGSTFFSSEWGHGLVDALERQAEKYHAGVQSMELVLMTPEQYARVPATQESARFFDAR